MYMHIKKREMAEGNPRKQQLATGRHPGRWSKASTTPLKTNLRFLHVNPMNQTKINKNQLNNQLL